MNASKTCTIFFFSGSRISGFFHLLLITCHIFFIKIIDIYSYSNKIFFHLLTFIMYYHYFPNIYLTIPHKIIANEFHDLQIG